MLGRALILGLVIAAHAAVFYIAWHGIDLSLPWPEPATAERQPAPAPEPTGAAGPGDSPAPAAGYAVAPAPADALDQLAGRLQQLPGIERLQRGRGGLRVRSDAIEASVRADADGGGGTTVTIRTASGVPVPPSLSQAADVAFGPPQWRRLASLPSPRSNVAAAASGERILAFYGLGPGKTAADISRSVLEWRPATGWSRREEVPVAAGRLAAAATSLGGTVYLAGGYTVAADGSEVSTPELFAYDPGDGRLRQVATMPVPVDDSLLLPWRGRWLLLVSGWHDDGNVGAVQLYDTVEGRWIEGTPWPGEPVFGHSGGLVGDSLVACDGVTARRGDDGRNRFALTGACFRGDLDPQRPGSIRWTALPPHPGPPLYRAAATGTREHGPRIVFAGGATRAYNYDGIGYEGIPAEPSAAVFSHDLDAGRWQLHEPLPWPSMDHRALLELDGRFVLVGGMGASQRVLDEVVAFRLSPPAAQ